MIQPLPPSRILIIAEGQIGDLLLLTPVFRALKQTFPSAELSLLAVERRPSNAGQSDIIARSNQHFLCSVPHLASVFVLRRDLLRSLKGGRRLHTEWKIVRVLREMGFDTVISAFPDDRFALWAWFSGARVRIGEAHKGLGWAYTRSPGRRKGEGSILDYFCELAGLAGCRVEEKTTEYVPSIQDEEWADGFTKDSGLKAGRFVLVHPGATGDYKIWPPERYKAMMEQIVGRAGLPILLCGGPQEQDLLGLIGWEPAGPMRHVHRESQVGRFAALAKRAALVISNDSGPRHIAVAARTPSLALFRRFHDREWGVYGESGRVSVVQSREPCAVCPPTTCKDRIPAGERYGAFCLRAIEVEEVVQRVLSRLT